MSSLLPLLALAQPVEGAPHPKTGKPAEGPLGLLGNKGTPPRNHWVFRRLERYRLQAVSRSIILDPALLNEFKDIRFTRTGKTAAHRRPGDGIAYCLRTPMVGRRWLEIWGVARRPADFRWLQRCGLVWPCPVCAGKITEARAKQVRRACAYWRSQGGGLLHLILTAPHTIDQSLLENLEGHALARRLLMHRKPFKRLVKEMGLAGWLRSLEVTYGVNGWHVHTHSGLFVPGSFHRTGWGAEPWEIDPYDDLEDGFQMLELHGRLTDMWGEACLDAGLGQINEHGVHIGDGRFATGYWAKWGLPQELTKSHSKHGRGDHMTPFDLLRKVSAGETRYRRVFKEFTIAFHGRQQLMWSKGLPELLKLDKIKSDLEEALKIEDD